MSLFDRFVLINFINFIKQLSNIRVPHPFQAHSYLHVYRLTIMLYILYFYTYRFIFMLYVLYSDICRLTVILYILKCSFLQAHFYIVNFIVYDFIYIYSYTKLNAVKYIQSIFYTKRRLFFLLINYFKNIIIILLIKMYL